MPQGRTGTRIGYLMSWYPVVTETFILHEMLELRRLGVDLEVYPLFGAARDVRHPGSEALSPLVQRRARGPWCLLTAQLRWLLRRPRPYLRAWALAIAGNARSPGFLLRALVVVPLAAQMAESMARRRITHVHAHFATHPALAAYVVRELTGIGYSFTAHAHDLFLDRSMLGAKVAAARRVVTISHFNRALIDRCLGPAAAAKTAVIPCGVNPRHFHDRPQREPDGVFRVVCVAALRDYKGHRWLVDACALLRERGVPFRCALVGDGPERARIEARVDAAKLRGWVELLGDQPHDRIRALLARSDAMVLPSVITATGMMDGIPVALMEAMAAGLPVVSTRVSGIPELVQDRRTGLLAPPGDAAALADALESLQRDPLWARRLAEEGRRHVLAHFNLQRNAVRLRDLLLAAAGRPAPEVNAPPRDHGTRGRPPPLPARLPAPSHPPTPR
jgi:colanic acid/amylovoran biosynthesis glycosyltransferase